MAGRRISSNIRKILDLVLIAEAQGEEMLIISVDFEKCFDKVEFEAVFGALKHFGYGSKLINMIKTTYTGFTAMVQNNGYISEVINIRRGVRQGGPNSSILFLHCAEILANKLRSDDRIEGIPVNEILYLLGQFADDMDAYVHGNERCLHSFFEDLEWFYQISGFCVNYDKTSVYRIGSLCNSNAELYVQKKLFWTNDPINVLGVWITHGENLLELNYDATIQKAQCILDTWSKHSLSLIGKVLIVNALVASLFVYKMFVLPRMSSKYLSKITDIIVKFLWNNGTSKISLAILQNNKECGGLGLVSLERRDLALKIGWIQILSNDPNLANLAYTIIAPILRDDIWMCNLSGFHVSELFPTHFWSDVLYAWSKVNFVKEVKDPRSQFVWLNSHILIAGKPCMWPRPYNRGLKTVNQLYDQGRPISAEDAGELFGLSWIQYSSLIAAIPAAWKHALRNGISITGCEMSYPAACCNTKLTSWAYKMMSDRPQLLEQKLIKWSGVLNVDMDLNEYLSGMRNIVLLTNIPKLRSFQYKLAQRALVTNVQLFKWGLKSTAQCFFCNEYEESPLHLFVHCESAKNLWLRVETWMDQKFGEEPRINFQQDTVIFHKLTPSWNSVKNFVCLLAKYYIYRQRCLGSNVVFEQFVKYCESFENIEKYYATKNGKLHKHLRKCKSKTLHGDDELNDFIQQYVDSM